MKARCNLIIDSCCDLPHDMVDREGVELIEFPFLFGEEEHHDDLGVTMDAHTFYERMRKGEFPTTAQVSIPVFTDYFERAAQSGVPTVYLSFTSGLSGSYDVAMLVLEQVKERYPEAELYVVDTLTASVQEAMLVYEAIRQRDAGLTASELVAWVEEARFHVDCIFMVDDLEALRRGGRIPNSVAYAGAKLDVKPLLNVDIEGKLAMKGVARGRKKGIKQMVDYYLANASSDPVQCLVTGNGDCPKDVEKLHDAILKNRSDVTFIDSYIGPVIGSHTGPGMLALVFWNDRDRRESSSVSDRIARKVKGE